MFQPAQGPLNLITGDKGPRVKTPPALTTDTYATPRSGQVRSGQVRSGNLTVFQLGN